MKFFHEEKPPVCLHAIAQPLVDSMHFHGRKLYEAAAVCAKSPNIKEFLEKNDPKALEQLNRALGIAICEDCNQPIPQKDIDTYRNEIGLNSTELPAVCSDCADLAAARARS